MKNFSIEFKWAAIATLVALIWVFIEKMLGFHDEKIRYEMGFALLFNAILILIYWLEIKQKKNEFYNGIITLRQAFMTGIVTCILITVFYPLVQYTAFYQISPDFIDRLTQVIIEDERMTLEEAQKNISFDMFLRNGISGNLSFGIVCSAVIAYFIQSKSKSRINTQKINKAEVVKVKKTKKYK